MLEPAPSQRFSYFTLQIYSDIDNPVRDQQLEERPAPVQCSWTFRERAA